MDLNQLNPLLTNFLKDSNLVDHNGKIDQLTEANFISFVNAINTCFNSFEEKDLSLQTQFENLQVVVDNTPCTISWINDKLEYQGMNKALRILSRIEEEEYIGKTVSFKTKDKYFYNFAKELFGSEKQTLYRELVSTMDSQEPLHFWVVGSKYNNNTQAVVIGIEITRLKQTEARLKESEQLAITDDLTGLYNMRNIYKRIEQELLRGERFHHTAGIVMMDIDHFKRVNDDHDHLFGSFVLSEIGNILRSKLRKIDFAARYGGDEFLIVLTQTNLEGMKKYCENLRSIIENHKFKNGKDETQLTISLGYAITTSGTKYVTAQQLVKIADEALYKAKNSGRNKVFGFSQDKNPQLFLENSN